MSEIDTDSIKQLEAQIRRGDHASVREFLRKTSRGDVPPRLRLALSQLSRRVDCAKKGVILLRDRIIDLPPGTRPDPREQAEYAACLLKLGGVQEARRLLRAVSADQAPEAMKFLAFTFIHEWDYQPAIPLLQAYVSRSELSPYEKLVASLNLSAALLAVGSFGEAETLLLDVRAQAEMEGHTLLLGNACELLAQKQIHTSDFNRANEYLELAGGILQQAQPRYKLYLQKWQAIIALLRNPKDELALEKLRKTRAQAKQSYEWETVRECDLYESIAVKDEKLFQHVYFGTPYPCYRQAMLERAGDQIAVAGEYVWGPAGSRRVIDVEAGRCDTKAIVKKGLGLHRLLKALSLDFYAPIPVAQLFAQVFDNEKFHPEMSARRIYELTRRLKADLAAEEIRLPILALRRGYKINISSSNCGLRVEAARSANTNLLATIEKLFGLGQFRLRELADRSGMPHTSAYREIKRLVADGELLVIGSGRETLYQLPSLTKAA